MVDMMFKICEIMNQIKGFSVGYSAKESKMLFELDGKRYVMEVREIEDPKPTMLEDMRRIRYL